MGKPLVDLTGQTFGRLTVIEKRGHSGGKALWACSCVCGNEIVVRGVHLRSGRQVSCGCWRSENTSKLMTRHGHAVRGKISKAYSVWQNMLGRVNPENAELYPWHAGRGIKVCERWLSFENFLADMGEPDSRQTIDRVDNDGDYEPGNCRWATMKEQNLNRRNNVWVDVDGKVMCREDAKKLLGYNNRKINKYVESHRVSAPA